MSSVSCPREGSFCCCFCSNGNINECTLGSIVTFHHHPVQLPVQSKQSNRRLGGSKKKITKNLGDCKKTCPMKQLYLCLGKVKKVINKASATEFEVEAKSPETQLRPRCVDSEVISWRILMPRFLLASSRGGFFHFFSFSSVWQIKPP